MMSSRAHGYLWSSGIKVILPLIGFAVGAFLRLNELGSSSLRTDEIFIISRSGVPLSSLPDSISKTVMGAPLEFIIRNLVLRFSSDEFFLRLPDALFGILTIIMLYKLASRLFDPATGAVAALLLAISISHIFHSQDARYYALFCLTAVGGTLFLLSARDTGRSSHWAAYTFVMILGFYNAYFMGFVALVHAVFTLAPPILPKGWKGENRGCRGFILSGVATALALAPWLFYFHPNPRIPYPPMKLIGAIERVLESFSNGPGPVEVVYVLLFLMGLGLALVARRSSGVLCILFLLIPLPLIVWIDNRFRYFFAPRQIIFALPFYLSVVAYGVVRSSEIISGLLRRPKLERRTAWVITMAVCLFLVGHALPARQKNMWLMQEDWREAARYLADRIQPGDVIMMTQYPSGPPAGDNISYYLKRLVPDPSIYRVLDPMILTPITLRSSTLRHRVWCVMWTLRFYQRRPDFLQEIQARFTEVAEFRAGAAFGKIMIYRSRP
jgi:hypothetical protein